MSLTYGFYNSINKDRLYNATQFSQIFDGIINDGIYMSVLNHFAVRSANNGMDILVGGGRAWFNHTWSYNDTDYLMTVSSSEIAAKRIDAVVLKIDTRDTSRINTIEIINGTPSENEPEKPTFIDENGVYYHPLAYITIDAGITEITDIMIENVVGVDERTPFVTGIIEHVHADDLIQQWGLEWDAWNQEHREAYEEWVETQEFDMQTWTTDQKNAYNEWISTQEASYETWLNDQETSFETWSETQRALFEEWVSTLHDILDEETAGHLQNEIEAINSDMVSFKEEVQSDINSFKEEVQSDINDFKEEINEQEFKRYYDLCTNNTTYIKDSDGNIIGWSSQGEGITLDVTITEMETIKQIVSIINDGEYIWTKTNVMDYETYTLSESYTKEAVQQ